jgi:excisionase family DNA binding protein
MLDPNTPIWQLTVGQLLELVEMQKPIVAAPIKEEEKFFNTDEACQYLRISKATLFRWRKVGYLKSDKVGGILRFRKSHLDQILTSNY